MKPAITDMINPKKKLPMLYCIKLSLIDSILIFNEYSSFTAS